MLIRQIDSISNTLNILLYFIYSLLTLLNLYYLDLAIKLYEDGNFHSLYRKRNILLIKLVRLVLILLN